MRRGAGKAAWLGVVLAALGLALTWSVSVALADTGDIVEEQHTPPTKEDGWQAGTCKSETPECNIEHPEQFFEQAAGHPQFGFTQIIVKHGPGTLGPKNPVGQLKTVRVDLPVGLSVNPQATEQCEQAVFEADGCLPGAAVGTSFVTGSLEGLEAPTPLEATVYNIVPEAGEPARFGFELAGKFIYLKANVAWQNDYHEGFTIEVPKATELEPLINGLILKNRLVFEGRSGNGTFITTPTTCLGPATVAPFEHVYSTLLRADSWSEPNPDFPNGSTYFESPIPSEPLPTPTFPKECDTIPFEPSIDVSPNTNQTDSPSGTTVDVELPFEEPSPTEIGEPLTKQASSQLKDAKVTLPAGMGLNPSAVNGLVACTDTQFGKGTGNPVECPAASKIGTVEVQTPPLPQNSLEGNVYLGQQLSRDPTSGNEYRIFVDAESARYGISVRLIGHVSADPQTGRLTTTFAENPQVPFTSFKLSFDGGAKASLTSPPTCGPNATTSEMTPWSTAQGSIPPGEEGGLSTNPPATPEAGFTLTSAPGGSCARSLGERPFKPGFGVKVSDPQGGAYSPLSVEVARADGEQELKGVNVDLAPGMSAKLAGVSYCPEAALAAAAANSGLAEAAHSSCPDSSLVGTATVTAGSGPSPIRIDGKAFLSGPFHGAPLSLAIVTPATAGPFDLGSVVVRVALLVDPATAQVHAVSDPIPHVFGGALLGLRSVSVHLDRREFTVNPTDCAPLAIGATLRGGGSDPTNPAAFSSDPASVPFQASGCEKLGFRPKLYLRTFGKTHRGSDPKLRAVLIAKKGDADIARASVNLPHAFFLDQSSLASICTREQFAARACPADSVYGWARAFSPLLDKPLEGPVYLRSSSNELPDMVAALRGQVEIDLDGRIDTAHGGIRTTFDAVPDVPVSKFVTIVRGGKHGLLESSRNLCGGKPIRAIARFKAQNGKKRNLRPRLRTPCKRHGGNGRRAHRR